MAALQTREDDELEGLKAALSDTPHVGKLVELTKTLDQARAVLTFLEACADHGEGNDVAGGGKSSCTTVSLTAARGRGK